MKILIADDEKLARQRLKSLIIELGGNWQVVAEAANGLEVLQQWRSTQADIILLDIRMPKMDGLQAAVELAKMAPPPVVIFTTAFDQHALQAFEANALDYLLKPIRKDRLELALSKAGVFSSAKWEGLVRAFPETQQRSHICVQLQNDLNLIPVKDILFFQADQKYVNMKTRDRDYLIDEPLKSLEAEFAGLFLRVHRNSLAALMQIENIQKSPDGRLAIKFHDSTESLLVSRRHAAKVRACVKAFKLASVGIGLKKKDFSV